MIIKIGAGFEFTIDGLGIYLRLGQMDWYYSRD